jgi:metal-responsive CopG/Arc/MetJ family transcriptional regulator
MAKRLTVRRRTKVSVTVDPALLKAVDSYIQHHDGMDRSKVMGAALTNWYATRQEEAMVDQFSVATPEEQAERRAWKRIRRAAAERRLTRTDG